MRFSRFTLIIGLLLAAALGLLSYSYFIEPFLLVTRYHEIVIEGFDPAFDGLRIAAVSDLHAGAHGVDAARLREVVAAINAAEPDLVVVLGDLVSTYRDRSGIRMSETEIADNLRGLNAPLGVFAVLGNHDGWFSNEKMAGALSSVGFTVLQDEIAVIDRNGSRIRLFGMRDHLHMGPWATFNEDMKRVVDSYPVDGQIILFQHSPDLFPAVNALHTFGEPYKLMIAGHTHGGQVWLPILGRPIVPSSFGQRYAAGHVKEDGKHLFVTTGVGTSILPFRFMVPPEIAILTVRSGKE